MITPVVLNFGSGDASGLRQPWRDMNVEAAEWYARVTGYAPKINSPTWLFAGEPPAAPNAWPPTHDQAMRIVRGRLGDDKTYSVVGIGAGSSGAGTPQGCLIGGVPFQAWRDGLYPRTQMWLLLHELGHVAGLSHPYGVWNRDDTIMGYGSTARFERGEDVGFTENELAIIAANPLWEKVGGDVTQAIDISNYSGTITPYQAASLYNAGVRRVVVQLVNPSVLTHRRQIPALLEAGLEVQGYVYVWFSAGPGYVATRVNWACSELALYAGATRMMWLDCEQSPTDDPPFDHITELTSPTIRAAVAAVEARGFKAGIYTAKWWWVPGVSNSNEWSTLPLWDADYDDDPAITPAGYGGWDIPTMKQYKGNASIANIPNVDFNSYDSYQSPLPIPTPEPEPEPAPPAFIPDVARALILLDEAITAIQAAADALTE